MAVSLGSKRNVKVYILYLMANIGYPLDFVTLNDIVRQNDFIVYLDFAEAFHELESIQLIVATGKNEHGEVLYEVTREGRIVADSFKEDIVSPILDKSMSDALRYLDFQRRGVVSDCQIERLSDARVRITFMLIEKKETIFKTELVVDSLNRAERMKKNFYEHPDLFYRGAMSLASGNVNYLMTNSEKE